MARVVLQRHPRCPAAVRARQIAGTADDILDLSDDVDPDRDHIRGPDDGARDAGRVRRLRVPLLRAGRVRSIRELLDSFGDDVRYVWRHLPLNDVHPNAQLAAEAAEAAAAQGAFWEMHDKLLAHQDELTPTDLGRYAEELGLDVDRFWDELRRREYAPRVAEDVASADASGVSGTPTFFINGSRHRGAYDSHPPGAPVRGEAPRGGDGPPWLPRTRRRRGRAKPFRNRHGPASLPRPTASRSSSTLPRMPGTRPEP